MGTCNINDNVNYQSLFKPLSLIVDERDILEEAKRIGEHIKPLFSEFDGENREEQIVSLLTEKI